MRVWCIELNISQTFGNKEFEDLYILVYQVKISGMIILNLPTLQVFWIVTYLVLISLLSSQMISTPNATSYIIQEIWGANSKI